MSENRTKFSSDFRRSDFRHSGCSIRSIVWLYYYKRVNVQNLKCLVGRVRSTKHLKSELFGNGTTLESAKIQTFGCITLSKKGTCPDIGHSSMYIVLYIQWNAEIRKSEIRIMPKAERSIVRTDLAQILDIQTTILFGFRTFEELFRSDFGIPV